MALGLGLGMFIGVKIEMVIKDRYRNKAEQRLWGLLVYHKYKKCE